MNGYDAKTQRMQGQTLRSWRKSQRVERAPITFVQDGSYLSWTCRQVADISISGSRDWQGREMFRVELKTSSGSLTHKTCGTLRGAMASARVVAREYLK